MKQIFIWAARIACVLTMITKVALSAFDLSRLKIPPDIGRPLDFLLIVSFCVLMCLDRPLRVGLLTEYKRFGNYLSKRIKDMFRPYRH